MSDDSENNPFESPKTETRTESSVQSVESGWLTSSIVLLAMTIPVYFVVNVFVGFGASVLILVASVRTKVDLNRKLAADCFRPGDLGKSFVTSIFVAGLAIVVSTVTFFVAFLAACSSERAIPNGYFDFVMYGIITAVGTLGSGILYFLGPASVEMLRSQKLAEIASESNDQGGESRETN